MRGPRNRVLGHALFSDQSQITIRMISRAVRLMTRRSTRRSGARGSTRAIRFRDSLQINATAFRLVHGEADLLPSLIVDRYGDYLVMQTLSQGMDRLAPTLVHAARRDHRRQGHPRAQRSEGPHARRPRSEGRSPATATVPETITVREAGITYSVDPWRGQKTGLFLDQRENREAAARYAHGTHARLLQLQRRFRAWRSRRSASRSRRSTSRPTPSSASPPTPRANGITNLTAREANVFDELRHLERDGARYDTIVLDPPAFAKNKASIPNALAGYKEINLRALRLLNPGGLPDHLQLLLQRGRGDVRRGGVRRLRRRPYPGHGGRKAHAGARPSGAAGRAGNLLPEELHPPETSLK